MVDLSTNSWPSIDEERFEKTMQSTGITGTRNLYLSSAGIPKEIVEELSNAEDFVNSGRSIDGSIYRTVDGIKTALSFVGEWKSNSSQVLVYFELDNQDWT